MKKVKQHHDQSEFPLHHKLTENILKKKANKQFQLLYRERDQSIEENPIENIIFVKSKPLKTNSNHKKIKVHEEFKKIMSDLNAHVNQHKKSHKSQKKQISTASTQLKTPFSTKKSTNQTEFLPKKHKTTEKDQIKILKTVNKGIQNLTKEKSPILETFKSPKKNQKSYLSPKSKQILSPKVQKFEKENIETKRMSINQKLQRKKSPQQKTNRKPNVSEFENDETVKKQKNNIFGQPSHQTLQSQQKTQIKRNIRSIPLKIEEYILIEDNFERIKKKSLYKLETKLLSTYRNNFKEFQNKLLLKENEDQNQIVFEKINRECFEENNQNFIERSSMSSDSSKNQETVVRESQISNQNEIENSEDQLAFQLFTEKVIIIQRWWRRVVQLDAIKQYLFKNLQKNQSSKSHPKSENSKNFTTPVNLSSTKSLQFIDQASQDEQNEHQNKLQQQNDEMRMLKNQNQIVNQKKAMHQKILKNLLNEKKITKDDFQNKMALVQRQYEKELKDIISLYKIIEFGTRSQELEETQLNEKDVKIIQGEKSSDVSQVTSEISPQRNPNYTTPQNQPHEDDVPLKIYKIGDKITTEMQNYIEASRKNKENSPKLQTEPSAQNEFISQKYSKKTNDMGEQYFEDFESDSSNEQSPHKILDASNFQEFESQITADNHGGSFEPNAHFIKMLERKQLVIVEFKQQEMVKTRIDQRIAVQMGVIKPEVELKYAVDTSILGIHQFLVNFFKFYLHYYKDEFLRFINMPYGYQPEQRLKFIQGYEDTSDDLSQDSDGIIYGLEYIISDDVFEEFVEQYYASSVQNGNDHQKAIIECSKIHDRALFECFNEALNNFRPYYSISGPPYIWNCSEKTLTFYFIAEENINEVFEKTEYRVMKWASGLLGLYVDGFDSRSVKKITPSQQNNSILSLDEILQNNQSSCHPIVFDKREENLIKEERAELIESMSKWGDIEEQRTSTLYELSSLVLEELAQEMAIQFFLRSNSHPLLEEFY